MIVGVFQFHGSGDIQKNHEIITAAIASAAQKGVRLLVFQECALCGYPPLETGIKDIDFKLLNSKLRHIRALARRNNMFLALGTVRRKKSKYYNSIRLIGPNGALIGNYDKRALWGWDLDNFTSGDTLGIYQIDDIKTGFRICYEVRFPEYFRELFRSKVKLCFVSFCDISEQDAPERYDTIKAHLITRAVENVMTVISVNSISKFQTAPTAVFGIDGGILLEAPKNEDCLLTYDFVVPENDFGAEGRMRQSVKLTGG